MNGRTPELAKELMRWFYLRNIKPTEAVNILIRVLAIAVISYSRSETDVIKYAVAVGDMLSSELDSLVNDPLSRELEDLPPEGNA